DVFFVQAEDGIRDFHVTGVQTCALPISRAERDRKSREDVLDKIRKKLSKKKITAKEFVTNTTYQRYVSGLNDNRDFTLNEKAIRSEERRVGKEHSCMRGL